MEMEPIPATLKTCSFLRARDPSVLAWNGVTSGVRVNLFDNEQPSEVTLTAPSDHLEVFLRLKKVVNNDGLYQISNGSTLLCKIADGSHAARNCRDGESITKSYTFSKIFNQSSHQTELFNDVVKEKVLHFINGLNCSLLTYGASGSGKTFTIVGTANEPGMVPRALEYLFRTLPKLSQEPIIKPVPGGGVKCLNKFECRQEKERRTTLLKACENSTDYAQHIRTYKAMQKRLTEEPVALIEEIHPQVSLSVWVSFAEIYNEHVYDLLKSEPTRGQTRQKLRLAQANGAVYIKDLAWINVSSGLEAYQFLQYGLHNLNYAATNINTHSSRSHSIFSIKLVQACGSEKEFGISSFNFCDLAGSERVKKTFNVGIRLKESNNINTSLMVLGRCISQIRDAQKNKDNRIIPFRESKLTQIFQKALLGYEAIAMMVNINPSKEMYHESQHVLNFSAIAKDVTIEQQKPIKRPETRFSQYMQARSTEINPIEEEDPRDVQLVQQSLEIERLYGVIEQQSIEYEEDRQEVIRNYKKILEDSEKRCEMKYERMKKLYEDEMERRVREVREEYAQSDVISLDSTSEEHSLDESHINEDSYQEKLLQCNRQINNLQAKVSESAMKLMQAEEVMKKYKMETTCLNERIKKLSITLEDAEKEYGILLTENNNYKVQVKEQKQQIVMLQEENYVLNEQISAVSSELTEKCEMIDTLEDKLSKII